MNSNQSKNGFKTFIVVAAFLAIVGSVLSSSLNVTSLEQGNQAAFKVEDQANTETATSPFKELASAQVGKEQPAVLQAATGNGTDISGTDGDDGDPVPTANDDPGLLAAAGDTSGGDGTTGGTDATESTPSVPNTGTVGITISFLLSFLILVVGMITIINNPRKQALSRFEKEITKRL